MTRNNNITLDEVLFFKELNSWEETERNQMMDYFFRFKLCFLQHVYFIDNKRNSTYQKLKKYIIRL